MKGNSWSGTDLPFLAEQPAGEGDDGSLKIGHGHIFADRQSLHLLKLDSLRVVIAS